MKTILIAYDGSECSEAIFTELQHAGLPLELDAHLIAVSESWEATVSDPAMWAPMPAMNAADPGNHFGRAEAMRRAGALAEQGAARLQAAFPTWGVVGIGRTGSVARAILERAREVAADAIFIGSHSRSAIGRFFLGSISQKVVAEAKCSVRICRPRPLSGAAPRLLVAVDGSLPSQSAARAVTERVWPEGTMAAAVTAIEPWLLAPEEIPGFFPDAWHRQRNGTLAWLETVNTSAHDHLCRAGLVSERHTLNGEPKAALLEWAETWNADCIFIGASGLQHSGSETLGTVAFALAMRAHCSVEIVRP